ncbi:MAG TPA: FAD-binding oxidoreductase [Rhizomicrobium sp.]
MDRRGLLKTAAAVALLAPAWPGFSQAASGAARRVRPTDISWPPPAAWAKLKDAVGGNLVEVHSLFGPCGSEPNGAECRDTTQNIHNPFFIGDQPGGTQVSGWLDAWTAAPSAYAVAAHGTADVAAAVDFARTNNLRLVVKGAGHSYQGTSNAPDSLLIWLRPMNKVTLHDAFVPQGCAGTAPVPAITAEAGAVWIDLYQAVTIEGGRYVQGGGCTDVGVAGLVQSGGFGSFSKGFGSAASHLLEAEIVTADGQVRIANACSNKDLFWALKGGGGGSWGVVTRLTLRTHDLPQNFGAAWGELKADTDDAFRALLARFFDFYAHNLFNAHWGEQVSIGPGNTLKFSLVCQGLDNDSAHAAWKPFADWVATAPPGIVVGKPLGTIAVPARIWWSVGVNPSLVRDTRAGAPAHHAWWDGDSGQVGAYLYGYDSLWLPASLLEPARRKTLTDALFAASRYKQVGLHLNKGIAGAPAAAVAATRDTATNPAVAEAFALVIIADGEGAAYPGEARPALDLATARKEAKAIDLAAAELRKIVPHAGSYVSESNYFNADWRQAFWGANYAKLRAVKDKYDPAGLFFGHHGVGSEDWSADGFTRLAKRS